MRSKMKVLGCLMLMLGMLWLVSAKGYAIEPTNNLGESLLFGKIVSVDLSTSMIVVEYVEEGQTMTIDLKISENAELIKNNELVALSNLQANDPVSVEYLADADGGKMVQVLTVE